MFGAIFLMQVFKQDKNKNDGPATTVGENVLTEPEVKDELLTAEPTEAPATVTEEVPPVVETVPATDKNILVLNSTDVTGLAGRWCTKLGELGYGQTTASDYSEAQSNTRIISTVDGVGQELTQYFNGASYEVGTVTSGTSVSTDGYDVVIIIGSADSDL